MQFSFPNTTNARKHRNHWPGSFFSGENKLAIFELAEEEQSSFTSRWLNSGKSFVYTNFTCAILLHPPCFKVASWIIVNRFDLFEYVWAVPSNEDYWLFLGLQYGNVKVILKLLFFCLPRTMHASMLGRCLISVWWNHERNIFFQLRGGLIYFFWVGNVRHLDMRDIFHVYIFKIPRTPQWPWLWLEKGLVWRVELPK